MISFEVIIKNDQNKKWINDTLDIFKLRNII